MLVPYREPAACLDNGGQPGAKSLWQEAAMGGMTRQRQLKWLAGVLVVASGATGCATPGSPPSVPSGLELAIADGDHVLVVDPANGTTLHDVTTYREVKRLAYRPDGARLAVGHCFQNRVAELETGAYAQVAEPITAASCPWAVAYRPDGLDLAALRPHRYDRDIDRRLRLVCAAGSRRVQPKPCGRRHVHKRPQRPPVGRRHLMRRRFPVGADGLRADHHAQGRWLANPGPGTDLTAG